MAMTWKTLIDLLAREFRYLRRMPVVSFGFNAQPVTNAADLLAEEKAGAERLDAIIRDFARTRRWPALDEKERYFLRERIRFAYEYCAIAEISVRNPSSMVKRARIWNEQRRLMEWFLIEVWRDAGRANWIEPLFLLTRSASVPKAEWELHISE
jgi:hypothetical protein